MELVFQVKGSVQSVFVESARKIPMDMEGMAMELLRVLVKIIATNVAQTGHVIPFVHK